MFHYNGHPLSAQDAADLISYRRRWRDIQLERQRERDTRDGTIWRQLWAMIRGRA